MSYFYFRQYGVPPILSISIAALIWSTILPFISKEKDPKPGIIERNFFVYKILALFIMPALLIDTLILFPSWRLGILYSAAVAWSLFTIARLSKLLRPAKVEEHDTGANEPDPLNKEAVKRLRQALELSPPRDKGPNDLQVINALVAFVREHDLLDPNTPITEEAIKGIQGILAVDLADKDRGAYRRRVSELRGRIKSGILLKRRMKKFVSWLNKNEKNADNAERFAAEVFIRFIEDLHPFVDANGRTGRTLVNLILLRKRSHPILLNRYLWGRLSTLTVKRPEDIDYLADFIKERQRRAMEIFKAALAADETEDHVPSEALGQISLTDWQARVQNAKVSNDRADIAIAAARQIVLGMMDPEAFGRMLSDLAVDDHGCAYNAAAVAYITPYYVRLHADYIRSHSDEGIDIIWKAFREVINAHGGRAEVTRKRGKMPDVNIELPGIGRAPLASINFIRIAIQKLLAIVKVPARPAFWIALTVGAFLEELRQFPLLFLIPYINPENFSSALILAGASLVINLALALLHLGDTEEDRGGLTWDSAILVRIFLGGLLTTAFFLPILLLPYLPESLAWIVIPLGYALSSALHTIYDIAIIKWPSYGWPLLMVRKRRRKGLAKKAASGIQQKAEAREGLVDINFATEEELQALFDSAGVTVSRKVIKRVVDAARERPFLSLKDVETRIKGLGPSILKAISGRITVSGREVAAGIKIRIFHTDATINDGIDNIDML
ncbi:MAG: Fic family protein, partial [Candidatus Omnitrophota bacterium]